MFCFNCLLLHALCPGVCVSVLNSITSDIELRLSFSQGEIGIPGHPGLQGEPGTKGDKVDIPLKHIKNNSDVHLGHYV